MLLASTSSFGRRQLGQITATPAEEAQIPRLTNSVTTLAQIETQLRTMFAQLLPDLLALQNAKADIPAPLLELMLKYNAAQAAFMEGTRVWLTARAQTPASDLPDPNAQPIAVPTFDIPKNGLGFFGLAKVSASTVKIKHGIIGKEITSPLSGYAYSAFSGYATGGQLGLPPLAWAIIVLVGLVIVGGTVVLVARALARSDSFIANEAIIAQAHALVTTVQTEHDIYKATLDACIGPSADQATRLKCIDTSSVVLKTTQENRPKIQRPVSPVTVSILTALGVLTVLGTAGGVGYWLYKRRGGTTSLPRAHARSRSGFGFHELED